MLAHSLDNGSELLILTHWHPSCAWHWFWPTHSVTIKLALATWTLPGQQDARSVSRAVPKFPGRLASMSIIPALLTTLLRPYSYSIFPDIKFDYSYFLRDGAEHRSLTDTKQTWEELVYITNCKVAAQKLGLPWYIVVPTVWLLVNVALLTSLASHTLFWRVGAET